MLVPVEKIVQFLEVYGPMLNEIKELLEQEKKLRSHINPVGGKRKR